MLHHLIKGSKDQAASIEEDKGAKGALNIGGGSNPTLDKKSNKNLYKLVLAYMIFNFCLIGIEVLRNKVKSVSKMLKMFRVLR